MVAQELGKEHQLAVRRGRRTLVPAHVHVPAQRVHHLCQPIVDTPTSRRQRLASCFTHRVSVPTPRKSATTLQIQVISQRQLPDLGSEPMRFEDPMLYDRLRREGHEALGGQR